MTAAERNARLVCALPEIRCVKCRRLLFYGKVEKVEIKCPKCGRVQAVEDNRAT